MCFFHTTMFRLVTDHFPFKSTLKNTHTQSIGGQKTLIMGYNPTIQAKSSVELKARLAHFSFARTKFMDPDTLLILECDSTQGCSDGALSHSSRSLKI